ncbi:tetratricopeptide repeat protein [Marinobacter koreensis]|uniref:Tetratricopeptide repeat protein n=1 Tax=Marinobacter koreensis TaxID=335974 RepID=A0ABW0RQW1_9GAMM|nr:tetratricopeptide repeat protein [Marinobacter koreensis]MCK7549103.1 tetratricopeptide repeat protein [Marinobacter koreensis]
MLAVRLFPSLFLGCLILALSPCLEAKASSESSATDLFRQGVLLFNQGRLAEARDVLEQAREAGLNSNTLHYNLGVLYYRLSDYDAAERSFKKLLPTHDGALARYNLGLVALAREQRALARSYFQTVALEADSDKLQRLARIKLAELGGAIPPDAAPKYQSYLSVSGGYDSNIAGLPEAALSRDGGTFLEAVVAGGTRLSQGRSGIWNLQGVYLGRQFPSHSEYDADMLQGRLSWSSPWANRTLHGSLLVSQSWFGQDPFETRYGAEGSVVNQGCFGGVMDDCEAGIAVARVLASDPFEAYDGHWYRVRVGAERRIEDWTLEGKYQWEVNDRKDLSVGSQFVSVSPHHHSLDAVLKYRVRSDLALGAQGGFRFSRYEDPHRLLQDGVLVEERRIDRRWDLGGFVEKALDRQWRIRGEWQYRDTASSIERYTYQRHTVMVTLEGSF